MLKNTRISLPEPVNIAVGLLENAGYEAFIVGGCVRDFLLGKDPKDIDITTNAVPKIVQQLFKDFKVIETGLQHGTVTIIIRSFPMEITTYRIDGEYSDNRRPDQVSFDSTLEQDLSRRDFTINALAYNNKTGVVDFHSGVNDLNDHLIRCVGNPSKRFDEDALRILRGLRFASVLGFHIDESTASAMFNQKELMRSISHERIAMEFIKLLCGINVKQILMEYADVLGFIIPELLPMKGFNQNTPYHIYDVLLHTAVALENIPPNPHLRLAVFFHDIGKPLTYSVGEDGIGHFYGHGVESERIALDVLTRLKFDNFTKERVCALVKYHDVPFEANRHSVRKWLNRLSPEVLDELILLKRADNFAQSPGVFSRQQTYDQIEALRNQILEERACFSLKDLKINGNDLKTAGISEGKEIGEILRHLLDMVMKEDVENERGKLLDYVKSHL
jgi:tRNA nucleotidyltransferase (CCA-adding enzyme)